MTPDFDHPTIVPRLARRNDVAHGSRAWITPGFSSSTAFISLSPGLVCVFDGAEGAEGIEGEGLTHQQIGKLGFTAHQAWNAAATALRATALTDMGVEFWARPASVALGHVCPDGLEVRGGAHTAAAWLAHPRTFATIHDHFLSVLDPVGELTFMTRDQRELFVFDAPVGDLAAAFGFGNLLRYSVGFPLMMRRDPAMA